MTNLVGILIFFLGVTEWACRRTEHAGVFKLKINDKNDGGER